MPPYDVAGFFEHQLRWCRSTRDSRRWGYAGLLFTFGLPWAFFNLIASGLSLESIALFVLALLVRVALALVVGVGILGDIQVLRDLLLLLPRDLIALFLWAWSFAGDTVTWRGERFLLKRGKLLLGSELLPGREHLVAFKHQASRKSYCGCAAESVVKRFSGWASVLKTNFVQSTVSRGA